MASLKEEGNAHYRCRNFQAAEDCYTRALEDASPDGALSDCLLVPRFFGSWSVRSRDIELAKLQTGQSAKAEIIS